MANIISNRKSGFITRSGVKRRETVWFGATVLANTLASGTPVFVAALNAAGLALRPFTIVRSRGWSYVVTDQEAADEVQSAAVGLAVVSDQASAIGVTALPTPVTDSASDLWFVYDWNASDFRFGDATGFGKVGNFREIDSKAMRKVEDGQDVVQVVENTGTGADFRIFVRMLVKLH